MRKLGERSGLLTYQKAGGREGRKVFDFEDETRKLNSCLLGVVHTALHIMYIYLFGMITSSTSNTSTVSI